jgi:hypothetical protein
MEVRLLSRPVSGRRSLVAGSLLLALAPKCPLCVLAYFGVVGAAGSLSAWSAWLAPMTALSLTLTIFALGWRTGGRIGPAILGSASAVVILAGKFLFDQRLVLIAGLLALLAAAMWRARLAAPCPIYCANEENDHA